MVSLMTKERIAKTIRYCIVEIVTFVYFSPPSVFFSGWREKKVLFFLLQFCSMEGRASFVLSFAAAAKMMMATMMIKSSQKGKERA